MRIFISLYPSDSPDQSMVIIALSKDSHYEFNCDKEFVSGIINASVGHIVKSYTNQWFDVSIVTLTDYSAEIRGINFKHRTFILHGCEKSLMDLKDYFYDNPLMFGKRSIK